MSEKEFWRSNNVLLLFLWLTLSWRRPLSYRNQSIDLQSKSVYWFLYDNGLRHERVKELNWASVYWGGTKEERLIKLGKLGDNSMVGGCLEIHHPKRSVKLEKRG